jgi:hypothetical protein
MNGIRNSYCTEKKGKEKEGSEKNGRENIFYVGNP